MGVGPLRRSQWSSLSCDCSPTSDLRDSLKPSSNSPHNRAPSPAFLVGRHDELAQIQALLDAAHDGVGRTLFVSGEAGVGKTRLLMAAAESAERSGSQVLIGRAYAVETGIPYALFADAFVPLLRTMDQSKLALLTRGGTAELAYLFPALGSPGDRDRIAASSDASELKARLHWNLAQLLGKIAAKQPLCLVLENLQWADASSLELFHFLSRQISASRIAILASYNETERGANPALRATEQSLANLGAASFLKLPPLSHDAVQELVHKRFSVQPGVARQFTALLYGWTRGNAFFVDETLKSLVESGALKEVDGTWTGWDIESLNLPGTVRDAVSDRIDRLSPTARQVADAAAAFGAHLTFDQLKAISCVDNGTLVTALEELARERVIEEIPITGDVAFDFSHPVLQQVVYSRLGPRTRRMHAQIAEALESLYGRDSVIHAGELAFHFSKSGYLASKAVKYLTEAGRNAIAAYANKEASAFLTTALEQLPGDERSEERAAIVRNLARARQRLGDYDAALELWNEAKAYAIESHDAASVSDIYYRMGLASFWSGRFDEALEYYESGLVAAANAADNAAAVKLYLARAICFQELGKIDASRGEAENALREAQTSKSDALLSRAHRALLLLYAWTGPATAAREHGAKALAFARASGESMLEWSAHWSLGVMGGLTGSAEDVRAHVAECHRLEEKLGSPLLPLWTAELEIQYASWLGDWSDGIATGERTLALARSLNQRTLVPRLLVWTGLIYLWRHDLKRARESFDEAWELSGAGSATEHRLDVQTVVPAHMGLAAYHLETDNLVEAIRIGEDGLRLADKLGYIAWSVQWLLPVIGEAALWTRDFDRAERHSSRMRRDGQKLGNPVAVAMADTGDAMLYLLRDSNPAAAIPLLQSAIDALERIPLPDVASRIRRALAQAFTESGDRESALKELRIAHDVFARLGAAGELENVRGEIRKLGSRPPPRTTSEWMAGLTGRELEIARMVAMRKSNREIGKTLDISARTVSTHLSNIFAKAGVASRGELADFIRERSLREES